MQINIFRDERLLVEDLEPRDDFSEEEGKHQCSHSC